MKELLWLIRKTGMTTFKNYKNWLLYLAAPVIGIVLSFMIISGSGDDALQVGIVNHDGNQAITEDTIDFISGLEHLRASFIEETQSNDLIVSGELDAVLVIPEGFAQSLKNGEPRPLRIVSIKGTSVTGYLTMYVNAYIENTARLGRAAGGNEAEFDALYAQYRAMEFEMSVMQSEDRSAALSMSKRTVGYLVLLMMFSAMSLSVVILKEKENRTYHRLLAAPVSALIYTISNVIVNFLVMMLQIAVTLFVMTRIFQMDPGIPVWLMFLILLLFALVAISLSLAIVAFSDSSMKANALQNLIIIPTSLLAGCMFPIEAMPPLMQRIGSFLPQQWLLSTIDKLQTGGPPQSVYLNLFILAAFALSFSIIAAYRFGQHRDMKSYY